MDTEDTEEQITKQLESLAGDYPQKIKDLWWISGVDYSPDYCEDCGMAIVDWLRGDAEEPSLARPDDHPDKGDIIKDDGDDEDVFLDGGYCSWDSDTACFCERCGDQLHVTLTRHGIESEIDHYEIHKPSSPGEWGEILIVWKSDHVREGNLLYGRTVNLLEKHLPDKTYISVLIAKMRRNKAFRVNTSNCFDGCFLVFAPNRNIAKYSIAKYGAIYTDLRTVRLPHVDKLVMSTSPQVIVSNKQLEVSFYYGTNGHHRMFL